MAHEYLSTPPKDPAEYPEIYPARAAGSRRRSDISVRLAAAYPIFDLCRSIINYSLSILISLTRKILPCTPSSRFTHRVPRTAPLDLCRVPAYLSHWPYIRYLISVRCRVNLLVLLLRCFPDPAASGLEIHPLLPDDCAASQKYASYGYPYFNLYPAPGAAIEMVSHPAKYPSFNLCESLSCL